MGLSRTNATITDLTAAVGLPNIPAGCESVMLQADGANVRYTSDGTTTPTSSVGMRIIKDQEAIVLIDKLADLKFIQESATAHLNILYQVNQ